MKKILSPDAGPFWQFVKYGTVGAMATLVQTGVFYLLASTFLLCLTADDAAVKYLGLPSAEFTGTEAWYATRGMIAACATAVGFIIANIFCWIMNRLFVFKAGKFRPLAEFAMFFAASGAAAIVALLVMKVLIDSFGLSTTFAVVLEVVVSFMVNFIVRKFFIFKG